MNQIARAISASTNVPVEQVRHILDEFTERADVDVRIDPVGQPPEHIHSDQPTLPLFKEAVAA